MTSVNQIASLPQCILPRNFLSKLLFLAFPAPTCKKKQIDQNRSIEDPFFCSFLSVWFSISFWVISFKLMEKRKKMLGTWQLLIRSFLYHNVFYHTIFYRDFLNRQWFDKIDTWKVKYKQSIINCKWNQLNQVTA